MRYLGGVSTLRLEADKCTGCGRCEEVCPHGVFRVQEKKARVMDEDLCMECGACARNCAFGAIKVDSGVGCAAALINEMLTGRLECGCSEPGDTQGGSCC